MFDGPLRTATGVLPLACGRATRLVRFLSAAEKEYDATVLFGVTTDTLDVTGDSFCQSVNPRNLEVIAGMVEV